MTKHECRNDLVVRSRRGTASASDQRALAAHLDHCETCRLTRQIGEDFDAAGQVDSDDSVRIQRLIDVGKQWAHQHEVSPHAWQRPGWRIAPRVWAAAMAVGMAAAAAGGMTWYARRSSSGTESSAAPRPAAPAPSSPRSVNAVHEPSQPPTQPSASPAASERKQPQLQATATAAPAPKTPASAPPHDIAPATPLALFRAANRARRSGDVDGAAGLFRKLQRQFPTSREALVSRVPLGGLLLAQGSAAAALREYQRYLSAAGGSGLGPEALYGKGRALAALGQRQQERETWQLLLRQHPGCPYSAHARRRLTALK